MLLRNQHRFVIEMVADYLSIEPDIVMNGVIDYARHIELMDSLFAEGGRRAIMFYYQIGDPPEVGKRNILCTIPCGETFTFINYRNWSS